MRARIEPCACGTSIVAPAGARPAQVQAIVLEHNRTPAHVAWAMLGGLSYDPEAMGRVLPDTQGEWVTIIAPPRPVPTIRTRPRVD